jgi:hypothetical protein
MSEFKRITDNPYKDKTEVEHWLNTAKKAYAEEKEFFGEADGGEVESARESQRALFTAEKAFNEGADAQLASCEKEQEDICKNCSAIDWAAKHPYLSENIEVDKEDLLAQERRALRKWGDEPCPHAGSVNGEPVLHKRECSTCWDIFFKRSKLPEGIKEDG